MSAPVPLRAGPLHLELDGPDLRYIGYQGHELVRRVYMAVRDLDWDTIGGEVRAREVHAGEDGFEVRMELAHRSGEIAFDWVLEASGRPDGSLSYLMRGRAAASFAFAKIGLNLHHAIAGLAGRRYVGTGPFGRVEGRMPERIFPQIHLRDEGWDLPVFPPVASLSLEHEAGRLDLEFGGDLYEMEDQRNWSDQSYKTYSMPAYTGYRHEVQAGDELVQQIQLRFTPASPGSVRPGRGAGPPVGGRAWLAVGGPSGRRMPALGLGHAGPLSDAAVAQLAALRPAHLRLDVDLAEPGWEAKLDAGLGDCRAIGAAAELALFLSGDPRPDLGFVGRAVRQAGVPVARVLVFRRDEEATSTTWIELVRAALGLDARVGGGTNMYFTELNRSLPDLRPFEVVAYSVNPQVHAFDDRSLVESLEGQAEQVRSARLFAETREVAVTPVSLKPRFNAVATTPQAPVDPDALPGNVDVRQPTLFAAAWTLGSIAQLAAAGADSVTYYETTGPRGVLAGERPAPAPFPPWGAPAFPLYHPLADAARLAGCELLSCKSGEEPWLAGLAARTREGVTLLVANLCAAARTVAVALPHGFGSAAVRTLDETTLAEATGRPAEFRARQGPDILPAGLVLPLDAYATARVELR
jgi:hypothetical protein